MKAKILVAGVLVLGLLLLASGALADVKITVPKDKQKVAMKGKKNEVRVTISQAVPETSKVVLFIRDPLYNWWPWLNSAKVSGDSHNWIFRGVQFGNENDEGCSFKLVVVVCTETEMDEGVKVGGKVLTIEAGKMVPNTMMKAFLKKDRTKATQSAQVTVIRE